MTPRISFLLFLLSRRRRRHRSVLHKIKKKTHILSRSKCVCSLYHIFKNFVSYHGWFKEIFADWILRTVCATLQQFELQNVSSPTHTHTREREKEFCLKTLTVLHARAVLLQTSRFPFFITFHNRLINISTIVSSNGSKARKQEKRKGLFFITKLLYITVLCFQMFGFVT